MVTHTNIYTCVYTGGGINSCICLLCLRRPEENNSPGAMNTPNTQILVSNTILQQSDLTIFWRNGCSRTRGGSIENELRDSCNARKNESAKKKKKKRKRPTKTGVKSKGHKNQCRVSSGYIWNKIDTLLLDYNPKYKLNVHKLVHSNINK